MTAFLRSEGIPVIGMENRELHTPRLTLRLVQQIDAPALRQYLEDGETAKPAGFLPLD